MIDRFDDFTSSIMKAYKCIQKLKSIELEKFGLKGAHAMCLISLGRNPKGLTHIELCDACQVDKSAISKSVSSMQEKGYVTQITDGNKKYRSKFILTDDGMKIYDVVCAYITKVVEECGEGLSDSERSGFYDSLHKIVEKLEKISEEQ